MSDSTPPPRLLDADAPTAPPLRALLTALLPHDPTDEADARIEARILQTLAAELSAPEQPTELPGRDRETA